MHFFESGEWSNVFLQIWSIYQILISFKKLGHFNNKIKKCFWYKDHNLMDLFQAERHHEWWSVERPLSSTSQTKQLGSDAQNRGHAFNRRRRRRTGQRVRRRNEISGRIRGRSVWSGIRLVHEQSSGVNLSNLFYMTDNTIKLDSFRCRLYITKRSSFLEQFQ